MISPAGGLRIYVATRPTDFRNYVEPMIMQSGRERTSAYQGGALEVLVVDVGDGHAGTGQPFAKMAR